MKYAHVTYDWKQGGCEDEWEKALGEFDLVLTEDPVHEGSDQYAYFITHDHTLSKTGPTKEQLREIMIDVYGEVLIAEFEEEPEPEPEPCPTCGKTQDKC
jgi:hypothetical protein